MIRSRPYARHLLAVTLVVAGLVLGTAAVVSIVTLHQTAAAGEARRLQTTAAVLADDYRKSLGDGILPPLPTGDAVAADLRLTLLDAKGNAVADSTVNPARVSNRLHEPEVQQALKSGTGSASSYRIESGKRERAVCVAVYRNGSLAGFAVASSGENLPWQLAESTMFVSLLVLLMAGGIWMLLAVVLTQRAARPVAELADALERRSIGSLAGLAMRADVSEVGRAQKASYALLQESEDLLGRERSQSATLSAILESVPQSIIILDGDGAVLSVNHRFEETFAAGMASVTGHHLAELVDIPDCLAAIDRCRAEHKPQSIVAEDRDRYYACSVQELADTPQRDHRLLVVLGDITEAMTLPRMKADFVANASHELKTPLTAIRGYLELLHEEPGNTRYLKIIERNVDRLIALSSDISLLSRMENRAPEIELVDMKELQTDLSELFEKQAREHGIPLLFHIESDGRFLYGDRLMLLQMFINLIENSYRFTRSGTITVSAASEMLYIILSVTDTGEGIPAPDLPRIFERFYSCSTDRGRTGTGLGLAIVKRIVLAHNGIITVDSTVGSGTTFTIRVPKNLGPRKPLSPVPSDVSRKEDA